MSTKSTTTSIAVTAGAIVLLAAGCGLNPGGAWNRTDGDTGGGGGAFGSPVAASTGDDATDQSAAGLCPATSPLLRGAHPAGDVCSSPSDCASTCCDCGTGSQSWLAASCVAGRCVDSLTSCNRTNATYCGGGGGGGGNVIVVPGTTGQCGNTTSTTACEACIDTSCCAESLACSANSSCLSLESCDASCANDQACRTRCYQANPGGTAALQTLDACVASACGAACEP